MSKTAVKKDLGLTMIELWNMVSVDGTYSSAELVRVMRSGAFNSKVPFIIDSSKSIRNGKERAQ